MHNYVTDGLSLKIFVEDIKKHLLYEKPDLYYHEIIEMTS